MSAAAELPPDPKRIDQRVRSELLPDLDPALIVRCLAEDRQTAAVRNLRAARRGDSA